MFLRNELNATCVRLAFGRFTALIDRCRSFVSGPLFLIPALLCALTLRADQKPYFVTYDHELEDVGDLEISLSPIVGLPKSGNAFLGSTTELEYGVRNWWTTSFYLDGQSTRHDSTLFTGFRWENRLRPFRGDHWINPVLYIEYEHLSEADKTLKEVVGFGPEEDNAQPNSQTRREPDHAIETKLILSSTHRGWNVAENFTAEKNLGHEPWEFGYAWGVSRPLSLAASPRPCNLCREKFHLGVEVFGGLGNWQEFGPARASHYAAPVVSWALRSGMTLQLSPAFGLTANSHRKLWRFNVAYEFPNFDRRLQSLFH